VENITTQTTMNTTVLIIIWSDIHLHQNLTSRTKMENRKTQTTMNTIVLIIILVDIHPHQNLSSRTATKLWLLHIKNLIILVQCLHLIRTTDQTGKLDQATMTTTETTKRDRITTDAITDTAINNCERYLDNQQGCGHSTTTSYGINYMASCMHTSIQEKKIDVMTNNF